MHRSLPQALLLSGPSGVGKGTLCALLLKEFPEHFAFSVSHTTRQPRRGETSGVQYHFVARETMEPMIQKGDFVEHALVHGELYGTSFAELRRIEAAGKVALLDVEMHGVRSIKAHKQVAAYCVGVVPPSFSELETRLRGRRTETEEQVQTRLERARLDVVFCRHDPLVDELIVNFNSWSTGYPILRRLVHKWFPERFPEAPF